MHVCMHVCMYVCMYGWMHVFVYVFACLSVCMYAYMYACMDRCIYLCMFLYVCLYVCVTHPLYESRMHGIPDPTSSPPCRTGMDYSDPLVKPSDPPVPIPSDSVRPP